MKKHILPLLLALALTLSGCASLLERSYTVVEPYTDRYWDTAAEDTLRAESYQDLVNSLLMLVEQRSAEGVIRYYGEHGIETYMLALAARREVLQETVLGSYLLRDITLTFSEEEDHCSLTFALAYREEAGDPEDLMVLSGTQSLVDLLRMAAREGHATLTARFFEKTSREDIENAVESLWQELQQEEQREASDAAQPVQTPSQSPAAGTDTQPTDEVPPDAADGLTPPEGEGDTAVIPDGEVAAAQPLEAAADTAPPCPWTIRFYPDRHAAEIVEILLTGEFEG